jgi:hypothetical protein
MFGGTASAYEGSWQHILVMSSGALRRWERNRAGGWFLEDATQPKAGVDSGAGLTMNPRIVRISKYDDSEYRGIPYTGRQKSVTPEVSDDESDDTTATEIVVTDEVQSGKDIWIPTSPAYSPSPPVRSPTSPAYSPTSPPPIRGEDDIDLDEVITEEAAVQWKEPSRPDPGLTSMAMNNAKMAEETKGQSRKYPARFTAEHIAFLQCTEDVDSDNEEIQDVAPRRKKAKGNKGQ